MPTATYQYNGHSATLAWPDNASQDYINGLTAQARQAMISKYGDAPGGDSPGATGSDSFGAALDTGLGNAASGLENVAGDAAGALGYSGAAKSLRKLSAKNQNAGNFNGNPIGGIETDVGNIVHGKNIGTSLANAGASIANLAALQGPTTATALGLGAIPGAGPGLTAAYLGANAAGNTIQSRMDNQGEAAPSAGDYVAGGVNGVAQGALGAFGLGKLGAAAIPGVAAKSALKRYASNIALDAATSGVGSAVGQAADTAGTPGGLQISPTQIEQSAAEGGIARGLMPSRGPAADPDLTSLQHLADVHSILSGIPDQKSPTGTVNYAAQQLQGALKGQAASLARRGLITSEQRQSIFNPLLNIAISHKTTLGDSGPPLPQGVAADALAQFNKLGLPAHEAAPTVQALQALDTMSQSKLYKQGQGPFSRAGGVVGHLAGVAGASLIGRHLPGPFLLEDLLGYKIGGTGGAAIGNKIDQALGLSKPAVVEQAANAAAKLKKLGVPTGPNSLLQLQQLQEANQGVSRPQPVVAPNTPQAQANQSALIDQLGPDHPVAQAAAAQMQQAAPQAAPGPQAPVSPGPTAPAPEAAPGAPQAGPAPQVDNMGHPLGSLGNKLNTDATFSYGKSLSPADLHAALDSLGAGGEIGAAPYSLLKDAITRGVPVNNGGGDGEPFMSAILQRALGNDKATYQYRSGGAGGVPNGGDNPVMNAYQHATAATSFHDTVNQTIQAAARQGDNALANFVLAIKNNKNISQKQAMLKAFASAHPESLPLIDALNIRALVTHGKPQTK